jgi:hypothetical protein
MLLRYVALHGFPCTEEGWARYRDWKRRQMALPECRMTEPEGEHDGKPCAECPGRPGCPKLKGA